MSGLDCTIHLDSHAWCQTAFPLPFIHQRSLSFSISICLCINDIYRKDIIMWCRGSSETPVWEQEVVGEMFSVVAIEAELTSLYTDKDLNHVQFLVRLEENKWYQGGNCYWPFDLHQAIVKYFQFQFFSKWDFNLGTEKKSRCFLVFYNINNMLSQLFPK